MTKQAEEIQDNEPNLHQICFIYKYELNKAQRETGRTC